MGQEEADDLIQMINPEQDNDLKVGDLPDELSIYPLKILCCFQA